MPDDETVNQMIARSEEEFEDFQVCNFKLQFGSFTTVFKTRNYLNIVSSNISLPIGSPWFSSVLLSSFIMPCILLLS